MSTSLIPAFRFVFTSFEKFFTRVHIIPKNNTPTLILHEKFTRNYLIIGRSLSSAANSEETEESSVNCSNSNNKVIEIELNEQDLIESFVKGSGNGGQKINTTSNCVDLRHIPTGIRVQCQQTRSLQQNRSIARKIMIHKLDNYFNGDLSKSAVKRDKIKKRETKRRKRAKEKYGNKQSEPTDDTENT
ncbi:14415_t:CDS:2, partial [Acaulospora morrowiae]